MQLWIKKTLHKFAMAYRHSCRYEVKGKKEVLFSRFHWSQVKMIHLAIDFHGPNATRCFSFQISQHWHSALEKYVSKFYSLNDEEKTSHNNIIWQLFVYSQNRSGAKIKGFVFVKTKKKNNQINIFKWRIGFVPRNCAGFVGKIAKMCWIFSKTFILINGSGLQTCWNIVYNNRSAPGILFPRPFARNVHQNWYQCMNFS